MTQHPARIPIKAAPLPAMMLADVESLRGCTFGLPTIAALVVFIP